MTPDYRIPIKSTWRDPIGKPLTNRAITERMKQGWYGVTARFAALAKTPKSDFVHRCEHEGCGETLGVKHLSFKYLPKPMFLCPRHRMAQRNIALKNKEVNKVFKDKLEEFV